MADVDEILADEWILNGGRMVLTFSNEDVAKLAATLDAGVRDTAALLLLMAGDVRGPI